MSIVAYVGLPGSGKSYGVVENVIIPALKAGRLVVHNMHLEDEKLIQHCGAGSLQKLPEGVTASGIVTNTPAGAYLVLDEVWRYWAAGQTANKIPEAEKEFFAMHRHKVGEDGNTQEICLVTQDLSQISGFLRQLVEQTFRSTKLTAIGSKNRYRIDVYEGAVTGQKPSESRRIRQIFGKYQKEIFDLYRSHTLSNNGAGNEEKADDRGNLLKGWKIKLSVAAILGVPFMLWIAAQNVASFENRVTKGKASERSEPPPPEERNGKPQPPPPPPPPAYSTSWRLAGSIVVNNTRYYLAQGLSAARRIVANDCGYDMASNMICKLDGELVAEWTGPQPSAVNQFFSAAAAPEVAP